MNEPALMDILMEQDALIWIGAALIGAFFGVFELLWDLLHDIFDWLIPFEIVDQYEMGVVLRWGKYSRTVGPGFRWMWPFGIEELMTETVVRTTSYLEVQSITSKDGKPVNINAILVYKIGNIKRWLLEVDDAEDALHDMTYGIISELAECKDWSEIMKPAFMEEVTLMVQDEAITWGARVEAVKLSDRVTSRSIRLWTGME